MLGITDLADTYLDRCVSACNLYVETYNSFWHEFMEQKIIEPLTESFKADRFKSMTGLEWKEAYNGYIRSSTDNKVSLQDWLEAQGGNQ